MQAKLLRVLQEKEVRPVGSNRRAQVDVRVIAATNRDLDAAWRAGTFRKDLFFRLNVVSVALPALRDRKSDVPALVHWFLESRMPDNPPKVTPEAMNCFLQYDWPGNVRELENSIERALALGNGRSIDVHDLPLPLQKNEHHAAEEPAAAPASSDLEDLERLTIQRVFNQVQGDKVQAGKMLGISRATLYRKLKRYKIQARTMSAAART